MLKRHRPAHHPSFTRATIDLDIRIEAGRSMKTLANVQPLARVGRAGHLSRECPTYPPASQPPSLTATASSASSGLGGMATVYLAQDRKHDRTVGEANR